MQFYGVFLFQNCIFIAICLVFCSHNSNFASVFEKVKVNKILYG